MKQRAAQRIQVAAHVDVAGVASLLGADVVERAQRHSALGQPIVAAALEPTCQAHVDQLGPPVGVMMIFEGLMSR